jgi:HlyD family secretion protein
MGFSNSKLFKAGTQWLIAAGAIALVGTGSTVAYMLWADRFTAPLAVRVVTVSRGTVDDTLNESGIVELGDQQTLKSPAEGAVDRVLAQSGDRVKAGQLLAVLRTPERQTATAEQQLRIEQQQTTLERSRQQIAEAEEQLAAYRENLTLLQQLLREGAVARTEVRDQEEQIRLTEANLQEAKAETNKARLELERLKVENREIQQQIRETQVTAPTDGIVLQVNINDGDGVQLRTELLTLGNPKQELVRLQLSTLNAARVKVGLLARVSAIGPDPQVFIGRIVSIAPMATTAQKEDNAGDSEQSNQSVVPTVVRLDQAAHRLIPGSQVNVEIVLESQPNVIILGTEAIQYTAAAPFVWVLDEQGRAQQRPVELGLEGLVTVEVEKGLRVGERVILPPSDQPLTPGTPVVPEDG